MAGFYEETYRSDPARAGLYAEWRRLSAVGKAEHAVALCRRAGLAPASTLMWAAAMAHCCASCDTAPSVAGWKA